MVPLSLLVAFIVKLVPLTYDDELDEMEMSGGVLPAQGSGVKVVMDNVFDVVIAPQLSYTLALME